MSNMMFMPEKYKDVNRDELIRIFFSEYYELAIAVNDNTIVESMLDYANKIIAS